MSKLYIANLTRQNYEIHYRLPNDPRKQPYAKLIPRGGQGVLNHELSAFEISKIIEGQEKYGLIDVKDIDRTKAFTGVCYSIDKEISAAAIEKGIYHNDEVLGQRGQEIREHAAIAINAAMEQTLDEQELNVKVKSLEIEVSEVSGSYEDGDRLEQTINVTRDPADKAGRRTTRGKR